MSIVSVNKIKTFFYALVLSCILLGYTQIGTGNAKEVYKSDTLLVQQISDHVYIHVSYLNTKSFGRVACNGMIVVSDGEAVVFDTTVDDQSSGELIDWLNKSLHAKVTAVIPAHYHDDNLGGLREFHKRQIPSYALQKTIQIAKEKKLPLPQHGFDQLFELKVGKEPVYIEFLGEGHTCDNIIGYLPSENIMFGGCLVKETGAGKGNLEEANVNAWPDTIKKIKAKYPEVKIIVPGHGTPGGTGLLDYTIKLFEQVEK